MNPKSSESGSADDRLASAFLTLRAEMVRCLRDLVADLSGPGLGRLCPVRDGDSESFSSRRSS